jgi:sorting nexin-1/2
MVIRKKEQKARLEMGGRMDKLPMANDDVSEWENRLEESQSNFAKISKVIKVEIEFFERYRVKDFKNSIIAYLVSVPSTFFLSH